MDSKRLQDPTFHERMMFALFVAVTWWATLEAWRPWNAQAPSIMATIDSAQRYASAQESAREPLATGKPIPYYRWLASGKRVYGENQGFQRTGFQRTAIPLKVAAEDSVVATLSVGLAAAEEAVEEAVEEAEEEQEATLPVTVVWADPLLFEPLATPSLLQTLEPTDALGFLVTPNSLESLGIELLGIESLGIDDETWQLLMARALPAIDLAIKDVMVEWQRESLRVVGYDTIDWWHVAGENLAQMGQPRSPRPQPESLPHRFASPRSLLQPLVLTDPSERLAMIPARPALAPAPRGRMNWEDSLVEAVRPYCAENLSRTLQESIFVEPTSLVAQLKELSNEPDCELWALKSLGLVVTLTSDERPRWQSTGQMLEEFARLSGVAEELASATHDPGVATQLRRARYAMWRRIECWQAAYSLISPQVDRLTLAAASSQIEESSVLVSSTTNSPVLVPQFLALVESYESHGRASDARLIADQITRLAASPDARRRAMGESMLVHYRNANARLAITTEMLERFLPAESPRTEPVHDRILGTPVRGHATTVTRHRVALQPDPNAWRLNLMLEGVAHSRTIAFERSVRVRTIGTTQFWAQQQLVLDGDTLHSGPVKANAQSHSQFVRAASKYDTLPLVGGFIRSRAASGFTDRRNRAQREVAAKTARRVESEMAEAVASAMERAKTNYQTRVTERLAGGGVEVEPIELRTTSDRLIARVRIAHDNGLTAHTPRPRAPSDSLASLQLHQSGLTNIAAGLDLAGERLSSQQLADRFAKLSPGREQKELSDDAAGATIEFAKENPVTIKLADGRAELTLSVRELVVRRRSNRNFKVHVYYKPVVDGLDARFVHAEGPYFEGKLRNSERMRLQTIFGKVFPADGDFAIGNALVDDTRLKGLMITQLVIDDGWLGIALGPERHLRSAQLDRYAPLR